MSSIHLFLGVTVVALFLAASAAGGWSWWAARPLPAFWPLLRAAQGALVAQVALGGILLAAGEEPEGELHLLYGLLPLGVSFVAEQLRISAAEQILEERGLAGRDEVEALPAEEQRVLVLTIVRRETGVMALAALVCFGLVARAALIGGL